MIVLGRMSAVLAPLFPVVSGEGPWDYTILTVFTISKAVINGKTVDSSRERVGPSHFTATFTVAL